MAWKKKKRYEKSAENEDSDPDVTLIRCICGALANLSGVCARCGRFGGISFRQKTTETIEEEDKFDWLQRNGFFAQD